MRKSLVLALVLSLLPMAVHADRKPFLDLDFEMPECAGGWYPDWSVFFDWRLDDTVHASGRQSLRIQVEPDGIPFPYGSVVRNMPASEVAGKRVRLSGLIRTEDVSDYASFWFASRNAGGGFSYVDLAAREIRGTTPWTRYSLEIDVPASSQAIIFGPEVSGSGAAWFDDLELEIDGKKWRDGGTPHLPTPSPGHIDWLRRNAIPFATQRPGNGFADLQPLKSVLGDARIVSLGEATHGTREFFEMKHRLLEFLATEMGFKYFSIEAYMPEAQKINEYVLTGQGDPAALLRGLRFWTWNTQEVLDMILWMRAFNASGRGPVQFTGFDMQSIQLAVPNARAFLVKADPTYVPAANAAFARVAAAQRRGAATAEDVAAARGVIDHMTARREAYLQGYSREEVDWAIQNARIVVQKAEELAEITGRDESMAKNVEWLVDQAPAGSKFVLWAHNGHVNRKPGWMGHYLDQRFGDDMYVLGFAFREGSYNAFGPLGLSSNLEPPPPLGSLETLLQTAGLPRFILDLRNLEDDAPMIWLQKPRPLRSIGAFAQRCSFGANSAIEEYDGLIWIETSTPSRLLPL